MYYTVKKVSHKINFDIVIAFKVRLILYIDTKCKNEFPRDYYICVLLLILLLHYIYEIIIITICYKVWSS